MITHIDDSTFKKAITNERNLILVDFSARWCGPCKMMKIVLEQISDEYEDVRIFNVDVEESPKISNLFSVMSIPTIIFISKGKVVDEVIGFSSKKYIEEIIEDNL